MMHAFFLAVSTDVGPSYPSRPANVPVSYATGQLVNYGLGNHSGSLTILRTDGTRESFIVTQPKKINGRHYLCQNVPWVGEPKRMRNWGCSEIPPDVVVRRTIVRVTYWMSRGARVSDEIDAVK